MWTLILVWLSVPWGWYPQASSLGWLMLVDGWPPSWLMVLLLIGISSFGFAGSILGPVVPASCPLLSSIVSLSIQPGQRFSKIVSINKTLSPSWFDTAGEWLGAHSLAPDHITIYDLQTQNQLQARRGLGLSLLYSEGASDVRFVRTKKKRV